MGNAELLNGLADSPDLRGVALYNLLERRQLVLFRGLVLLPRTSTAARRGLSFGGGVGKIVFIVREVARISEPEILRLGRGEFAQGERRTPAGN